MIAEFRRRVISSITLPRILLLKDFITQYIATTLLEVLAIDRINDYSLHTRILCLILANFMRIKGSDIAHQIFKIILISIALFKTLALTEPT
jgi:hypothetical protein